MIVLIFFIPFLVFMFLLSPPTFFSVIVIFVVYIVWAHKAKNGQHGR